LREFCPDESPRPRVQRLQPEKSARLNPDLPRLENKPAHKSPGPLEPGRRIQMAWTWAIRAWMREAGSVQREGQRFDIRRDRWNWSRWLKPVDAAHWHS